MSKREAISQRCREDAIIHVVLSISASSGSAVITAETRLRDSHLPD